MRRKEPSKHTNSPDRRFTLSKSAILRGKRNFQRLFSNSTLITTPSVKLRFAAYLNSAAGIRVGFVAPKKTGNAVKRNRTKRLLREAYRLNQHILDGLTEQLNIELHFLFIARHTNLTFHTLQKEVVTLLENMRSRLLSNNSPF
ncbi:MAG: ribonuclease P protein component [Balneolaceae bacterium]|nr:ribonuclease P protein component [Balneolaceae bacterium]